MANSRRALEEAFETGSAALASMAGQRERLKARALCACLGRAKTAGELGAAFLQPDLVRAVGANRAQVQGANLHRA